MSLKPLLFTARVLWGALLMSTVIYVVVLQILPLRAGAPAPAMAPTFGLVALMLAAMSFVLPRRLRRSALLRAELSVVTEADPGGVASFYRDQAPTRRIITDRRAAHKVAAQSYMTSLVLALSFSEAVALLGFVLGFLGAAPPVWIPFFVGGMALIAIRFPTLRRVVGPLEETLGATIAPDAGGGAGE